LVISQLATTNVIRHQITGKVARNKNTDGGGRLSGGTGQLSQGSAGNSQVITEYWMGISHAIARNLYYPLSARNRGVEGVVKLTVTINAHGKLVSVSSDTSVTDESLRDAAVRAVYRTAPFPSPVTSNITESLLTAVLPVRFELSKEKGPEEKM
jgi:protein TonB